MVRKIHELESGSLVIGELPEGCKFCRKGSKMVLFVTGLCNSNCFYCPLSQEKAGKDVIFADEMLVSDEQDILFESRMIDAEGVGISGGDPLCQLERTNHYIELLRSEFGNNFHIHLYTSETDVEGSVLESLIESGLDEIRFHPQSSNWSGIERAVRLDMDVGIEVPALPNGLSDLKKTAQRANNMYISFMNVNELEASESNFSRLVALGMRLTDTGSACIEGSSAMARNFVQWASVNLDQLNVHYCTAQFKDAVQMRNRLERRLKCTKREFEERDDSEPLLILGIIQAIHGYDLTFGDLKSIENILIKEFDVPYNLMNIDTSRMRVEIAPWILDEIADQLKLLLVNDTPIEMGIAFEYPSWDRLQTLFNPL